MDAKRTIDVLNKLIQINNDRIEGYETASKETQETDLKDLFTTLIETSEQCKEELEEEVAQLGGIPTETTKVTGKFFRAWMDVKAALTGKNRKLILDSCEYGEDMAVKTYQDVIRNNRQDLTEEQFDIVREQYDMIKDDHDQVRTLRDAFAKA